MDNFTAGLIGAALALSIADLWARLKSTQGGVRGKVLEAVVRDREGTRITLTTTTALGRRMRLSLFRDYVADRFPAPDFVVLSADLRPAKPGEV